MSKCAPKSVRPNAEGNAVAAEPLAVLDAFAVLAFKWDEPAAGRVERLIREGASISAVNAAEVIDRAMRLGNATADDAVADIESLGVRVDEATPETGVVAGRLRATYYASKTSEVSIADCFAAAHALALGLPLATADEPLARMVEAEGGRVIRLPRPR